MASTLQIITGLIHLLSFLNDPIPSNETEKQLFDLMSDYKFDFGAGFQHSINDILNAFSLCFSLLFLYSGTFNLFLIRQVTDFKTFKGILMINLITFFICMVVMIKLTFLPPVVLTCMIFTGFLISFLILINTNNNKLN